MCFCWAVRQPDAVGVGTLCTQCCGGRGVLCEGGGCCVVGERGYTTYPQNDPSRLQPVVGTFGKGDMLVWHTADRDRNRSWVSIQE